MGTSGPRVDHLLTEEFSAGRVGRRFAVLRVGRMVGLLDRKGLCCVHLKLKNVCPVVELDVDPLVESSATKRA